MKLLPILSLLCAAGSYSIGFLGAEVEKNDNVKHLIDFSKSLEGPEWKSVNDGVMGGLSKGKPEMKDGKMHFTGVLSLENNGGFSSIRVDKDYDFSGKTKMLLRVRGDGRTYQLRLSTDARYNDSAISYGTEFSTEKGKWIEVKVTFKSLSPSWRGRNLDGPPLDLSEVEEIGILIGDKKEGPFELEIDWITVE